MSTAGKVLIVLILLMMASWVFLTAQVAELNRNWGKQIQSLSKQVEDAAAQAQTAAREVAEAKTQIDQVQRSRESDLTRLRAQLSDVQKNESLTREFLDRYTLQMTNVEAQLAAAQQRAQTRLQERDETRKALVDALAALRQVASQNNELMQTLLSLRQELTDTLEANRAAVEQARQRAGNSQSTSVPRTRAASLAR